MLTTYHELDKGTKKQQQKKSIKRIRGKISGFS